MQELKLMINKAINYRIEKYRTKELEENVSKFYKEIIGNSEATLNLKNKISLFADNDNTVLILGESGVGKELVARQIHQQSGRKKKPFIAVNCAALPKDLLESELFGHERGAFTGAVKKKLGKFELAQDGTIFLDEIAELDLKAQVKLLRVLQEKEFDRVGGSKPIQFHARIIAATNKELFKAVNDGTFREDLYYRLFVLPIEVPPLRNRKTDIPILLSHFGKIASIESKLPFVSFSEKAIKICMEYNWPGNIRELQNFVTRSIILANGKEISEKIVSAQLNIDTRFIADFQYVDKIPQTWKELDYLRKIAADTASRKVEKLFIDNLMKMYNHNVSKAAEKIGINRITLHKMIKKSGYKRYNK
jgi:transcriptional regulator with GAF, ATPase, and Fis domain